MSRSTGPRTAVRIALYLWPAVALCWTAAPGAAGGKPLELTVPPSEVPMAMALLLPGDAQFDAAASWQLEAVGTPSGAPVPAQFSLEPDRKPALCFVAPAAGGPPDEPRRYRLVKAPKQTAASFRIEDTEQKYLRVLQGDDRVLTYNYGTIQHPDVSESMWRSCYVHPIYGLDGEMLSDDFPKDHRHHRGLFWTWARVIVGGAEHDLWAVRGCVQRFDRVLHQDTGPVCATLGIANRWLVGEKPIVKETVWLRAFTAGDVGRAVDVDVTLEAIDEPLTIGGRPDKGYSGMTLRFAPREDTVITTPAGKQQKDSDRERYAWADLSARFGGAAKPSGAALFDHAANPGFPNGWTLRPYGVLDCAWPGVATYELKPGAPLRLRYRIWLHRGDAESGKVAAAYEAFQN